MFFALGNSLHECRLTSSESPDRNLDWTRAKAPRKGGFFTKSVRGPPSAFPEPDARAAAILRDKLSARIFESPLEAEVAALGIAAPRSMLCNAAAEILAAFAKSACFRLRMARAPRICSGVIIAAYTARLESFKSLIRLALSNVHIFVALCS